MTRGGRPPSGSCRSLRGAATVEFALVSLVFLALVIGVVEFSRLMLIYASAVEATRYGARVAVVCSVGDSAVVKTRMRSILSLLQPENISISYPGAGCSASTCNPVTVTIQNLRVQAVIPFVPMTFQVPAFTTSLPAETLDSTDNVLCEGG